MCDLMKKFQMFPEKVMLHEMYWEPCETKAQHNKRRQDHRAELEAKHKKWNAMSAEELNKTMKSAGGWINS